MKKHEKSAVYSAVCDLEAWMEFTSDERHKSIVGGVIFSLKHLIEDMYPKKESDENAKNVLTR